MNCSNVLLILSLLLFAVFVSTLSEARLVSDWAIDDTGCITPDKRVGDCIEVHECEPIIDFLSRFNEHHLKPLSKRMKKILRTYICSVQYSEVKVCCPRIHQEKEQEKDSEENLDVHGRSNRNRDDDESQLNLENCGSINSDNKIYNGNESGLFEFPWMAILRYQSSNNLEESLCAGSLITDRHVLTAAHCVTGSLAENLRYVRLGEHNVSSTTDCEFIDVNEQTCAPPVQDIRIEDVFVHPDYDRSTQLNDIALLRLQFKANLSAENVKTLCLPTKDQPDEEYGKVIVAGWGSTENATKSDILLKAELPLVDNNVCKSLYRRNTITERQICVGNNTVGANSCGGDSGGPIHVISPQNGQVRYVQHGIVSLGPWICGLPGYGIHTKLSSYLDWIHRTVSSMR